MKLRNLTQHTVNIVAEDGTPIIDFPSEGTLEQSKHQRRLELSVM